MVQASEVPWVWLGDLAVQALRAVGLPDPGPGPHAAIRLPAAWPGPDAVALRWPFADEAVWWVGNVAVLAAYLARQAHRAVDRWPIAWSAAPGGILSADGAVMGIVNVTPDSFSDGGRYLAPEAAVRAADRQWKAGALFVDIGAESTRPGHVAISADVERARLVPVLDKIPRTRRPRVSVDTRKAEVAASAVERGVGIINDVSGGTPAMDALLQDTDVAYVLMFNRPDPWPEGALDLGAMLAWFCDRLSQLARRGVAPTRVAVDPGIGFGYGVPDNYTVLAHLPLFRLLDRPVLVGLSRKRFLGLATGMPPRRRDVASAVVAGLAVARGADVVRAHRVGYTVQALQVTREVLRRG
jgi:dihydropteroate synthase